MEGIELYRRRFIPDELIHLKKDDIISVGDERIVTKWSVLSPRHDFSHGASCYFIKEGFKVSKFLNDNNELLYWYCDIIDMDIDKNNYTAKDLLIDVIVYPNGFVKVVDLDEIGRAIENSIISNELVIKAMDRVDKLLKIIYSGKFKDYTKFIEEV